jgi:hypothetical protein
MIRTAPRLLAIVAFCAALPLVSGAGSAGAQSSGPYPPPGQTYPQGAYPGSGDAYPPAPGTVPGTSQPAQPAYPEAAPEGTQSDKFTVAEIVTAGHNFFGQVTEGLATVVEHAVASYGLPNGYILGQEASGAVVGGLRYGEGTLYTKNAGQHPIFWQGPSVGLDLGAEGNRTMMLVYNLPSIDAIYSRYAGVAGSAYLVAGVGMTVLAGKGITIVPIVSGVGARLGLNIGYLKFTPKATWNPF